ncbi:hypothetical protein MBLNU457_g1065t1 [Dothideomycetes sp. NU457]
MPSPTESRTRGWTQARPQTATASPAPASRYNDYAVRRPDPPATMEPAPESFGSLPRIDPHTTNFRSDQQSRQLPGLAELLNPKGRPEAPSQGAFRTASSSSSFSAPRPSITGSESNSHYLNEVTQPGYWQTPQSHVPSGPTATFIPRPIEQTRPSLYEEAQARAMPPPPAAISQMPLQPHQPQFLRPLPGADMRPRPSITAADIASQDARRDSARSNSFTATTNVECVGQREIPGKGLCFVYKDGGTCPTVIDGEVVNPMWGTTKAGKARKRLAQACLSCREKKIRCEPRLPKCLQCEKSKRECVMPSAQQNQNECASNASSGSPLPALSPAPVSQAIAEASSRTWTHTTGNAPKRRRSQETSPNDFSSTGRRDQLAPEMPTSRVLVIRSTAPITNGIESWHRVKMSQGDRAAQPPSPTNQPFPGAGDTEWSIDPYLSNAEATIRLVDSFFDQEYCFFLFPPSAFKHWVMNSRDKSSEELMTLYSLLAISSAQIAENTSFSKTCTERAVNAVASNFGVFSLALVQSRLFLSTLFLSKGQDNFYWEYGGAMLRALSAERLNFEEGCSNKKGASGRNLFDLSDIQLTECKRRTFWAAFFTDRLALVFAKPVFQIPLQSIHLKLPCRDEDYEAGQLSRAPMFSVSELTSAHPATASPTLTAMIGICQLMAEVFDLVSASMFMPESVYAQHYETQFSQLHLKLSHWYNERPAEIRMLSAEMRSCSDLPTGKPLTCLALYHGTMLHLHRRMAQEHATHLLSISRMLCAMAQNLPQGQGLHNFTSPVMAWAVFNAIDTLTAGGLLRNIESTLTLAMEGHKLLDAVSHVWRSTRVQSQKAGERIMALQAKHEQSRERREPESILEAAPQAWRMAEPMSETLEKGCDIMFEDDDEWLLEALQGSK